MFHRLVMAPQKCDYCQGESKDKIRCLNLARLNGTFYCEGCISECKKAVLEYIEETKQIPLYSLMDMKNINQSISFDFYRKSKEQLYTGKIDIYCERYLFGISYINNNNKDKSGYFVKLEFEEKENISSLRNVKLDNLFFHNKNLYEKLTKCENIFNDDNIIISFDELSDDIKKDFFKLNEENKNKKSSDFVY